jgi:hypothetical protein
MNIEWSFPSMVMSVKCVSFDLSRLWYSFKADHFSPPERTMFEDENFNQRMNVSGLQCEPMDCTGND